MMPRTLLLTRWAPDARYAGAEALRRVVARLPGEQVIWVSMVRPNGRPRGVPCRLDCVEPRRVHWRMAGGLLETLWVQELQAATTARQIASRVGDFKPERLWVLPELGAINVGYHLKRRLQVPLHATVYDALESARETAIPALYYPLYSARVRRFFRTVESFDTISEGLERHILSHYGCPSSVRHGVIPSSVPESWIRQGAESSRPSQATGPANGSATVRRLAFCGAMRCAADQWQRFLERLGALPYRIELDAYAWADSIPVATLPVNVTLSVMPYLEDEQELVRRLQSGGYHAAYLPLWLDARRALFSRTSLSSKLTTYAAAGLPVLVDGPAESAAWTLVNRYQAGLRSEAMAKLFHDTMLQVRLSEGARRLCREEFNLDRNVERLKAILGCQDEDPVSIDGRDCSNRNPRSAAGP